MKFLFTFAALTVAIPIGVASVVSNQDNGLRSNFLRETRMAAAVSDTADGMKCDVWTQLGTNFVDTQRDFSMARDALILAVRQDNVVKVYRLMENVWRPFGGNIDPQFTSYDYRLSLSADGNVVAIGDDKYDSNRGRLTIYKLNNNEEWKQRGDPILGENAGVYNSGLSTSLSSDGTAVAIGSPYASVDDNIYSEHGHVRIFDYIAEEWERRGDIITGEASKDLSGWLVKLSADGFIVAIGAPIPKGNGYISPRVKVIEFNADKESWQQLGQDLDDECRGDQTNGSLSMSDDGTVLALGAEYNDGNGYRPGLTRVYKYSVTARIWTQLGQDLDGDSAADASGESVDLSSDGSYVSVGAPDNDGGGDDAGSVRVYGYNPTNNIWLRRGEDLYGTNPKDFSGYKVVMSGDATVVAINGQFTENLNMMKWLACPTPAPSSTPTVNPTIDPTLPSTSPSPSTVYALTLTQKLTLTLIITLTLTLILILTLLLYSSPRRI